MEKELWQYEYKVIFYSSLEEKVLTREGVVLACSPINVHKRLEKRYLDNDDEFDYISIKARKFGYVEKLLNNLVIEKEDYYA